MEEREEGEAAWVVFKVTDGVGANEIDDECGPPSLCHA